MLLTIHPQNPQANKIAKVKDCLVKDGVIVYPTDTLYGLGCSLNSAKGIERICRIRKLDPKKARLSVIVKDIQQLSSLVKPLDKLQFKLVKKHMPGPFTFIFQATKSLPKAFRNRRDTIGIRIVDHPIVNDLLNQLEHPILSLSFKDMEEHLDYPNDPVAIFEAYGNLVDIVVDGGMGGVEGSTIVDFTGPDPAITRQGCGDFLAG